MATSTIKSDPVKVVTFNVPAKGSKTLTFSAKTIGILYFMTVTAAGQGAYLVSTSNSGLVAATEISKGSSISVSYADRVLTVSNSATAYELVCYFKLFEPGAFAIA